MSFLLLEGVYLKIIAIAIILIGYIYYKIRQHFRFWKRRGIPYLNPIFPFGNFKNMFLQRESIGEAFSLIYQKAKSPFVGVFITLRPALVICDFELAKQVLISNFSHFNGRGFYCDPKRDPLSVHIFALEGQEWKDLRSKLNPAFSTGKVKMMFDAINECGEPLTKFLGGKAESGEVLQMQDILARYTTDTIASVAFGIKENSIDNPDSKFRTMGKEFFEPTFYNSLRNALMFLYPEFMKFLGIKLLQQDFEDFMISVISQTIEYRETNKVIRKDALQLLIELKKTGEIKADEDLSDNSDSDDDGNTIENAEINVKDKKPLTIAQITAQALAFYIGGFETSSTAMAFCLYELAKNPDIQKRVQKEIDEILKSHNHKITYESLSDMKYLQACINETLRLYSPLPFLTRICSKKFNIPNSNAVIDEGTIVIVPIHGFQRDEKYFKDAETFNPDRFYPGDRKFKEKPFLAFGAGPKICIGLKLGQLQTQIGMATMLKDYSFTLADNMHGKLKFDPKVVVTIFEKGIQLKVNKR